MRYLKNIALPFALFACVFLSSCQKDDDAGTGPQTILSLQVDATYSETGDHWIFATDATGEVLDIEPYAAGSTVTLTSTKAVDKINVTLFRYFEDVILSTTYKNTGFSTYADIPAGTTLHFEGPSVDPRTKATAHFVIGNTGSSPINFSNGLSLSISSTPDYSNGVGEIFDLGFYGAPADILMTSYRSDVPVYRWAKGLKDGDDISVDFQKDFIPYPHQLTLNFEGTNSGYVLARDSAGRSYYTSDSYFSTSNPPVIGFIDGFETYQTHIDNIKPNGAVSYYKSGAFNLSPTIPTFTFSFSKRDFLDYAFTLSENYTSYAINWSYQDGNDEYTWWNLSAPAGTTLTKLNIPDEIAAKYPKLDVSRLGSVNISMTQVLQGKPQLMPGAPGDSDDLETYSYRPTF